MTAKNNKYSTLKRRNRVDKYDSTSLVKSKLNKSLKSNCKKEE